MRVFHIPLQERPFYLLKGYGKPKAGAVYLRRGTSTAVAKPDEIYEMGKLSTTGEGPRLLVGFTVPYSVERELEKHVTVMSRIVNVGRTDAETFMRRIIARGLANQPVRICVHNVGDATASDVNLLVEIPRNTGLSLLTKPQFLYDKEAEIRIEESLGHIRVWAPLGNIQPKFRREVEEFYVQAERSMELDLSVTPWAYNLPDPAKESLRLGVGVHQPNPRADKESQPEAPCGCPSAANAALGQ